MDRKKNGRPKVWDLEKVALNLIEWAKKDSSLNLNGFCITHDPLIPPPYLSIWAKEDTSFSKAYETAKAFVGERRERKLTNNELHIKAYDLNAPVYDYFLKEEKRHEKEFESHLKKTEESKDSKSLNINITNFSDKEIAVTESESSE